MKLKILFTILLSFVIFFTAEGADDSTKATKSDVFPFVLYDTDIGFGAGVKGFYFNPLEQNESFDLLLFASTKGERRVAFGFSEPDNQYRQRKVYDFAFDFLIDYDLWISNNFFGIGNGAKFEDREYYSREPLDISITSSRAFSPYFIAAVGLRYKTIANYNFGENSKLKSTGSYLNTSRVHAASLFINARYDTKNSFINPSEGIFIKGEIEFVPDIGINNVNYLRISSDLQYYYFINFINSTLATRLKIESLFGTNLPVQVLLPIGGNRTVRGEPQDRFLDMTAAVLNAELRYPIFWRFGGIIGFDAGKVWHSINRMDFARWVFSPALGLRFYFDTFVVRFDAGFSREYTGFYFNVEHMF
jgi:outer membrane protein assembly factor BamA